MTAKRDQIIKQIEQVIDPSRAKTLLESHAIKHLGIDPKTNSVVLILEVGVKNNEFTSQITRAIAKIVKLEHGFSGLTIEYEQARPEVLQKRVKILCVASGKGGVGKSTVTANLAIALTAMGKKVGIVDADIYGANMPKIFDIDVVELDGDESGKIFPIKKDGIEIISTAFLMDSDKALMWRGPMLGKLLKVFFEETRWSDDLDYLLVDLPPGTGDVMMDVKGFVEDAKLVLVTTPHPSASHIAIKAGFGALELKQEIIGVIENMSFYEIGAVRHFIFGEGGGKAVAEKLVVPLLAQLPIARPESGHHSLYSSTEYAGLLYLTLARKIISKLA
jgi:ATP-binding protein involved in chromosome partitioning